MKLKSAWALILDVLGGNMLALSITVGSCLALTGCGGSGGDNRVQQQPSSPPTVTDTQPLITPEQRRKRMGEILFGFFYADQQQVDETAQFVNYIHVPYCGQIGIDLARRAAAAGLPVILSVEELGFVGARQYRGSIGAQARLRDTLSMLGGVRLIALYTTDEPNGDIKVAATDLSDFCLDCRAVCAELAMPLPLMVTYTGNNADRPALEDHDWLAVDDYGKGREVLRTSYPALRAQMHPGQRYFYEPACAASKPGDPSQWRESPWIEEAIADELCIGIAGFDWCGFEGKYPGLRDGDPELRQAWADAGRAINQAKEQA